MDVSVVIVEYHSTTLLAECLDSIRRHLRTVAYEIIVLSNSSYDRQFEVNLAKRHPETRFVFNRKNHGFAKAVNIGIRESHGEYILIMNPDSRLLDGGIVKALQSMKGDREVGILAPRIVDRNGDLQDSFRRFLTPWSLVKRTAQRFWNAKNSGILEDQGRDCPHEVDWVSGACMLVRSEGIRVVGAMDEQYFMYVEDMDWCKRFWANGFKVVYFPQMLAEHDGPRGSSQFLVSGCFDRLAWIHLVSCMKFWGKHGIAPGR